MIKSIELLEKITGLPNTLRVILWDKSYSIEFVKKTKQKKQTKKTKSTPETRIFTHGTENPSQIANCYYYFHIEHYVMPLFSGPPVVYCDELDESKRLEVNSVTFSHTHILHKYTSKYLFEPHY